MSDTAAVLITYNSEAVIGRAIDSCLAAGLEVIVVDNASQDGTVAAVRQRKVQLIANPENLGFAGGANQGIRACKQAFVLLLNPDAALCGPIGVLENACRRPQVGAATGRLTGENGAFQQGFSVRRIPTASALIFENLGINRLWRANPVNSRYRYLDFDPSQESEVEQPAGAFLMIRRDAWEALGGFDEAFYPIWFEDVDFCKRLREGGWKILYCPGTSAIHEGGHSARQLLTESKERYWYGSLLEYAAKHYPRPVHAGVALSVAVGGMLRLLTGIVKRSSPGSTSIYAKVIRLACRSMLFGSSSSTIRVAGRKNTDRAQIHVP